MDAYFSQSYHGYSDAKHLAGANIAVERHDLLKQPFKFAFFFNHLPFNPFNALKGKLESPKFYPRDSSHILLNITTIKKIIAWP
ncbi:MAG: hypothetical protein ABWK15_08120 [Dissulfuribacterales bacterium]